MNRKTFLIFLACCLTQSYSQPSLYAQTLPSCADRPSTLYEPWVDGRLFCLELVVRDPSAGTLGFSALAVSDDGTLYAARPQEGEVYALSDTDGDLLPDTPQLFASGLERPNALTWHSGALYAHGDGVVYRIVGGSIETILDEVPSGGGFWGAGMIVEDDGSIVLATGAPCGRCTDTAPGRGAVLRYHLNGTQEVLASGLRSPGDLVVYRDALWVNDAVSTGTDGLQDGLFSVLPGAEFGFPRCLNEPAACVVSPAAVLFDRGSEPRGMAAYRGDAIAAFSDALLVVLHGNRGAELVGYQLIAVWLDSVGTVERTYAIIPNGDLNAETSVRFDNDELNLRGSGFYPRRPLDVAVSPQGWVYVSITDGWILALRGH